MVWLKRNAIRRVLRDTAPSETQATASTESLLVTAPLQTEPSSGGLPDPLAKLRKLLDEGHFPPGSRLPPERALAAELGVGRPALREAIKGLCALNVLESRRGSGTYVRRQGAMLLHSMLPPDAARFGLLDLLEARKILEPRAAWLAATRAGEHQLRTIETARQQLELHASDWRLVPKLDSELHLAIVGGAHNPVVEMLCNIIITQTLESRSATAHFALDAERMRREHGAIVNAIFKRQPDNAEQAMLNHLNSVGLDFISQTSR